MIYICYEPTALPVHPYKDLHIIMDKATKSFEEKRVIIDKIHGPRKRKDRNTVSHSLQDIDLPPIINSFSPPSHKSKQPLKLLQTITSQFKGTIESELDTIINDTLNSFKHERINKIIFTSPITNRLGKTYYRSNDQQSIYDVSRHKHHNIKKNLSLEQPEHRRISLNASLIGISKQMEPPYGISFSFDRPQKNKEETARFSRYEGQAKEKWSQPKQRGRKRERLDRLRKELQKFKDNDRFSPWRDEEGEQQLAV